MWIQKSLFDKAGFCQAVVFAFAPVELRVNLDWAKILTDKDASFV